MADGKGAVGKVDEHFASNNISSTSTYVVEEPGLQNDRVEIYQCNNCFTRYDKNYGDYLSEIDINIDFKDLADYKCPVCDAPKEDFRLIEVNLKD